MVAPLAYLRKTSFPAPLMLSAFSTICPMRSSTN